MVKQSNERNLVFPVLGLTSNFLTQKMEWGFVTSLLNLLFSFFIYNVSLTAVLYSGYVKAEIWTSSIDFMSLKKIAAVTLIPYVTWLLTQNFKHFLKSLQKLILSYNSCFDFTFKYDDQST